ncbi:MAG TPA: hypothetical protein VN721_14580 [Flavipsychrobacter sp.]|nr:hypothetical protein [Flavipsychrobacter sp.]
MKKFILLSIAFSFVLTSAMGKANSLTTVPSKVLDYYQKINLAELAICDSNFAEANKYYADAFTINHDKAFYRDLRNAFYAAMDSHEYALAEKYISQLLYRGLDSENISGIRKSYSGKQLQRVNAIISKYPNNIIKLQKDPLVKELKQLVKLDQDVRFYFMNKGFDDYMVDSVFIVDDDDAQKLRKIFKEKGVPNEAVYTESRCEIIIWHNTGAIAGGMPSHIFDTMLYRAVLTFDFDARDFVFIAGASPLSSSFKYNDVILRFPLDLWGYCYRRKILYPEYYNDTSEERINKERAKIGLESLNDCRKKIESVNEGLDTNSVLHKYSLMSIRKIIDGDSEAGLKHWLITSGKDAHPKQPYGSSGIPIPTVRSINLLTIDSIKYYDVIGVYKNFLKEYNQGQIYFSNWENKPPSLCWNCHAQVIENPHDDLTTDTGRYNKAHFVPGYQMFVDYGWSGYFKIDNIQLLFAPDSLLISFIANVNTLFYKATIRYLGPPSSISSNHKTVPWPSDKRYNITLSTKKYIWRKDNYKTEITIADELNSKGKKITTATYQITDVVKYGAYLDKVEAQKQKLDSKYATKDPNLHIN